MKSLKLKLPEKQKTDLSFQNEEIELACNLTGLDKSIFPALKAHPLLLLEGKSGSGKTALAKKLARIFCTEKLTSNGVYTENFCQIQVRKNWTHSGYLMGFFDNNEFKPTEFLQFILKAWRHKETPFFLCLENVLKASITDYLDEILSILNSRRFNENDYESEPVLNTSQLYFNQSNDLLEQLNFRELFKDSIEGLSFKEQLQSKGLLLPPNLITVFTHDVQKLGPVPDYLADQCWQLKLDFLEIQEEESISKPLPSGLVLGNLTDYHLARQKIAELAEESFLSELDEKIDQLMRKTPYFSNRTLCHLTIFVANSLMHCPSSENSVNSLIDKFQKLKGHN